MKDLSGAKAERHVWPLAARASVSHRFQDFYAAVKALPVFGGLARSVAAHALPRGCRVWIQPRAGLAQGLWLNADPRFELGYAEGSYEPAVQRALAEHLCNGGTFYDVGAHIGFLSLIAARLVSKLGTVYAFEAEPQNAERIRQHAVANGFAQIQVFPAAVWSRPGTLRFQPASEFSSHNQGSIVAAGGEPAAPGIIEVNALSLDVFAENHRSPMLIKIDVEGGEVQVLRGAERLFSVSRPALICEIHHQDSVRFIESYLTARQYALQWLTGESRFPRHLLGLPLRSP